MKVKICYNASKLEEILHGYELRRLPCSECSEDWDDKTSKYYFCLPKVVSIHISMGFWDTMYISMSDGSEIKAMSENVNTDDKTLLRINSNTFVSPELKINGEWVEATNELTAWIKKYATGAENAVSLDVFLNDISKQFEIYDVIEYPGVPTPSKHNDRCWGYSDTPLKLDERDIQVVLNGIEDELLRKKIECILYARVFKKR